MGPAQADEWGRKLYGEETNGSRAFGIMVELLEGEYAHLLSLGMSFDEVTRKARRGVRWGPIARSLHTAARDGETEQLSNAAAALSLIGLSSGRPKSGTGPSAMEIFSEAPLEVREAIADGVVAWERPKQKGPGGQSIVPLTEPHSERAEG